MRIFGLTAIALLILPPTPSAAAPSWQTAPATSVNAGANGPSTFMVQAYVTLPSSCTATRIRTYKVTSGLNRSFIVEEQPLLCSPAKARRCTVQSTFRLPIEHKFYVYTRGQAWHVTLQQRVPPPIEPICK